jgi:hypothetical protein
VLDMGSEIWEMPVFERLSDEVSILVGESHRRQSQQVR